MNNLPDVVGLHGCLSHFPHELIQDNFEATHSNIAEHDPNNPYLRVMNDFIYSYFNSMLLPLKPTIYDYLIMSLRDKDKKVCVHHHARCKSTFFFTTKGIIAKSCMIFGKMVMDADDEVRKILTKSKSGKKGYALIYKYLQKSYLIQ